MELDFNKSVMFSLALAVTSCESQATRKHLTTIKRKMKKLETEIKQEELLHPIVWLKL